jgi:ribosomal protein S14
MKQRKLIKNITYRKFVNKFEIDFLIFKSLYIRTSDYSKLIKIKLEFFFFRKQLNKIKSRSKNICILTGRSRGIYKNLKISRIILRDLCQFTLISGIQKYS